MTTKTGECWNCRDLTFELAADLGHGWLKCSKCGATHQQNPTRRGEGSFALRPSEESHSPPERRPRKQRETKTRAKPGV